MGLASKAIMMGFSSGLPKATDAFFQSKAAQIEGDFRASQLESNARISRIKGEEEVRLAQIEAGELSKLTKSKISDSRAKSGAQGIEIDTGSSMDVQSGIKRAGTIDHNTIINNAMKARWGYRVSATNDEIEAEFTRTATKRKSRQTLALGGLQALNSGLSTGLDYYNTRKSL